MRTVLAAAILSSVVCGSASAGGLFGSDGLIGGDVGNFLDKKLEEPVLTPYARKATVGAATTVGTIVGGPVGGVAGGYFGEKINERAAGETTFARPYQYQPVQATTPRKEYQPVEPTTPRKEITPTVAQKTITPTVAQKTVTPTVPTRTIVPTVASK